MPKSTGFATYNFAAELMITANVLIFIDSIYLIVDLIISSKQSSSLKLKCENVRIAVARSNSENGYEIPTLFNTELNSFKP